MAWRTQTNVHAAAWHAAFAFAWLVLYFVQTHLVAHRQVAWHRRLGITAACLAAGVVGSGHVASV